MPVCADWHTRHLPERVGIRQHSNSIVETRRQPPPRERARAPASSRSLPRRRYGAERDYLSSAQAYELISAPSAISMIFGVFHAMLRSSTTLYRRD